MRNSCLKPKKRKATVSPGTAVQCHQRSQVLRYNVALIHAHLELAAAVAASNIDGFVIELF